MDLTKEAKMKAAGVNDYFDVLHPMHCIFYVTWQM